MNDPFKTVENIGVLARKEPVPAIDVSHQVISRLVQVETETVAWWPPALFAGGTAVAACAAFWAGLPLMELFTDPWSALMASSLGLFI